MSEDADNIKVGRHNGVAVKGRTRFFHRYASEHSVRLSALLFLLACHTRRRWEAGKRGKASAWHSTADWFGHQLGITERQARELIQQGQQAKLLDYQRTARGLLVWVSDGVRTEFGRSRKDEAYLVGYYYPRLARVFGVVPSIVYRFFKIRGDDDDDRTYRQLGAEGVAKRLPWLTIGAARKACERLFALGFIDRRRGLGRGLIYFFNPERRQKLRKSYSDAYCKEAKKASGQNFRSLDKSSDLGTKLPITGDKSSDLNSRTCSLKALPSSLRSAARSDALSSVSQKVFQQSPVGDVSGSASRVTSSVEPEAASLSDVEPGKEVKPGKALPVTTASEASIPDAKIIPVRFSGSSVVGYKTQAQIEAAEQQPEDNQAKRVSPVLVPKQMAAFLKVWEEFDRTEVEERMRKCGLL